MNLSSKTTRLIPEHLPSARSKSSISFLITATSSKSFPTLIESWGRPVSTGKLIFPFVVKPGRQTRVGFDFPGDSALTARWSSECGPAADHDSWVHAAVPDSRGPRARWAGAFMWTIVWCNNRRWDGICSTSPRYSRSQASAAKSSQCEFGRQELFLGPALTLYRGRLRAWCPSDDLASRDVLSSIQHAISHLGYIT